VGFPKNTLFNNSGEFYIGIVLRGVVSKEALVKGEVVVRIATLVWKETLPVAERIPQGQKAGEVL